MQNSNKQRNTYKWLLKREEQKARAKGADPEELKSIAIVGFFLS